MTTSETNEPVTPALFYNHVLALLGISPQSGPLSIDKPVKVAFNTTEERDAYIRFTRSAIEQNLDFPMELNSYNAETVVVTPSSPLLIEAEKDGRPVIVNIGTLIMEPGGQIECYTKAFVTVGEFIKK